MEYKFIAEIEDTGLRIDKYLSQHNETLSRSYLQKLIENHEVLVAGKPVKSSYKVTLGDVISLVVPEAVEAEIEAENLPLDIVYEDSDLLVINKAKGMVVHPAPGHYTGTLVNALMYHCKEDLSGINGIMRPGIVHRIDRDTTGLLLVCKNDHSHNHIAAQFKAHSILRKYHAIVHGVIKAEEGTINAPIGRHPVDRMKMSINPKNGRDAITHYQVLQRFQKYTYIECQLETGRTHQIRVHMASLHHPLLGDEVYGFSKPMKQLQGQTLHAKKLGFIHPVSGEYMEFDSLLPDYFQELLNKN